MANQIYPNWTGSSSESVEVNSAGVSGTPNFNNTLPAAPSYGINASWLTDGMGNISAALTPANISIAVNTVPVSDDYTFFINSVDQSILVNSSIPQNAHPAYANSSPIV